MEVAVFAYEDRQSDSRAAVRGDAGSDIGIQPLHGPRGVVAEADERIFCLGCRAADHFLRDAAAGLALRRRTCGDAGPSSDVEKSRWSAEIQLIRKIRRN